MKAIQYGFLAVMFYVFAMPAAIGIFDAWAWLIADRQLSWIDWTWTRGWLAVMLLVPAVLCNVATLWMRDAADRREG